MESCLKVTKTTCGISADERPDGGTLAGRGTGRFFVADELTLGKDSLRATGQAVLRDDLPKSSVAKG